MNECSPFREMSALASRGKIVTSVMGKKMVRAVGPMKAINGSCGLGPWVQLRGLPWVPGFVESILYI